MESSVIPFCQNWPIVSAVYIFQAINQNQPLNPNTTTGYNLKEWLEEAAQYHLPSIDLSKFDDPDSQSSLQARLNELYLLLKNNEIPFQQNSIKYLSISNKKIIDERQINKKTIAFFAKLEGSGNIQTNLTIKNTNWRLSAVFSGKANLCFCFIQNRWRNLSCRCNNKNWNWSDAILCYAKGNKFNSQSINFNELQNIDCLFCNRKNSEVNIENKNAGKNIKNNDTAINKNQPDKKNKKEISPAKKLKNSSIEEQKKEDSAINNQILIVNTSMILNHNKPITSVELVSKTNESNKKLSAKEGPIFQDFSCQYPLEDLCPSKKENDFGIKVEHQTQIDNLKNIIKQREQKIEDLELTSKDQARKVEKCKNEIQRLQDIIKEKDQIIKKSEHGKKEINSKPKLNDKRIEETKIDSSESYSSSQNTQYFMKELKRNFLIVENLKESIMIAPIIINPTENIDQIKNKNPAIEEVKTPKESLSKNSSPIFQFRKQGLPNIGNCCYMNSLLQILASTNCFVETIQNAPNFSMLEKLSNLSEKVRNKSTKQQVLASSLKKFIFEIGKEFPHISSFSQQDSKEIFQIIASSLDEAIPNNNIFSIFIKQNQYCYSCKVETHLLDEYQSFLIIPTNAQGDLETIVKERVTQEKIYSKKNELICGKCKKKRTIKIKMVEHKWPEVLVLYFPDEGKKVKLEESMVIEEYRFSLYGVVKYFGSGMFGHYTSMTKDGNVWNMYNDREVNQCNFSGENKYLAFFKRIDK